MVSVIIPIYNVEKYLTECIDSVLAQEYTDLEIILVDDGSTDKCGMICDDYAKSDSRIKVIHKENGGLSDARNAGLAAAVGEYIYFLDSDDYIRKDALGKLVKLASVQKADIIFFNALLFFDDKSNYCYDWIQKGSYYPCSGVEMLSKRLKNCEWFPGVPIHFYSSEFIKKNNLKFKKGIFYEDQIFSASAFLLAEKVCFIKDALYYYRQKRDGSIMAGKASAKGFISYVVCIRELFKEKRKQCRKSLADKNLEIIILGLGNNAMDYYSDMNPKERRNVVHGLRSLRKTVASLQMVSCKKLRLKSMYPNIWLCYRKTKDTLRIFIVKRSRCS